MTATTSVAVRPQSSVAPAQAQNQNVPSLDFSAIPPHIMARAAQIAADVMAQEGGKINPAQALSAAYHFDNTGEVYGRHSYVGTKGNVAGRVLEGYRAVARELDMSRYQWRYRPLNADEEKMHSIQPGDRALICELDVLAARRQCIEMHIDYQPVVGCTVIRKGEPLNVPKNRTSLWVMQKQARNDALRQVGENTETDEVLAEAGISDAPEGYMSVEQAEALVRERLAEALRAAQTTTPAELQARAAANVATMRGPQTDDPLGIDTPQPPPQGNDTAGWDDLVTADTERAAAAIREIIVGNCRPDDARAHPDMRLKFKQNLAIALGWSAERHALTAYLFGTDDAEQWTQSQCMRANSWLGVGKTPEGWDPSAQFVEDWKIIKAALPPAVESAGK